MSSLAIGVRCARLGEMLVEAGLIDAKQLLQALEVQKESGQFLGEVLVSLGFIKAAELGPCLKIVTGFPFVSLGEVPIDPEAALLLPEQIAKRMRALPFCFRHETVCVAMADPLDLSAVDELRARLNRRIAPYLALDSDLQESMTRIYSGGQRARSVLDEIDDGDSIGQDLSVDELVGMAEDAPIVRLVNSIIQDAASNGSSDIHIEPQEHGVRVRFRQDGILYDQMTIPRAHLPAVISRIKIMAHLNIAERRRPQDGRFVFNDEHGESFDLRVSSIPLIYGEKIVMRVLKKTGTFGSLDKMGLLPEQRSLFDRFVQRSHGILLITGPTGSGKSTTLYSILNRINQTSRNINTIEDPVEYHLQGINQMQVMPQIGITFAAGLRTLMRQDPDVIMVGEIRDKETAETAIQAALTGHLVLSTLHTNDAPGALVRLQNMGIEPFLISSALIGVIGQRLVRTICPHCKQPAHHDRHALEDMGIVFTEGFTPKLMKGVGCQKCGGRGMSGRTAIYEVMSMSDTLRTMSLERRSGAEIRAQAIKEGMITMRDAGIRKLIEGYTTTEEITRVLFTEEG